jgi:YfiH family protein|tara:strand:- start:84 stop:848 length:765 start_codon:yes stop_codon:yes gene_type:complete
MYFSKKFTEFKNLKHCFFSKNGGVSKDVYSSLNCGLGSNDKKNNVINNLAIVAEKINVSKNNLFLMNQTHSNKVVTINENNKNIQRINADALITKVENIGISVLTADCVPILIYEEVNHIIACIHAGWRGAVNGIVKNTLNEINNMSKNNKIYVAVGPSIGVKNYEVGKEFYNEFIKENNKNEIFFFHSKKDKFLFDLRKYVNFKINEFNIEHVENIDFNTYTEKESFFSFRRSRELGENDYGRCISTISLTST